MTEAGESLEVSGSKKVPPPSPKARESKRMMSAGENLGLRVSVAGAGIGENFGPAAVLAEIARLVDGIVDAANGGQTVIYSVLPGNSMVFEFGDVPLDDPQRQLAFNQTAAAAKSVAKLIRADDPEVAFARGMEIGASAAAYAKLAAYSGAHEMQLKWHPAGGRAYKLTPGRARAHAERLMQAPEYTSEEVTVNGTLYRVITLSDEDHGSIGIDLYEYSHFPFGYNRARRRKMIVPFTRPEVQDQIKEAGLIGEPVEVRVALRHPRPGTAIDTKSIDKEVLSIEHGPGPHDHRGPTIETMIEFIEFDKDGDTT